MLDLVILSWVVFLIIFSALLTAIGYVLYSGLFSVINIRTGSPPIKNVTIAYKYKQGPYKACGPFFTESCSIGPKLSSIGVFYDDPQQVLSEKCRYAVGSILCEGDGQPCQELLLLYQKRGFRIFSFPEVTHVVTTSFPHRTPLSVFLGVQRVYPQMDCYIKVKETMEDGSFVAFCHFLADLFTAISKYSLLLQRNDVILPQAVSSLKSLILTIEAMAVRPCPGGRLASLQAAMKRQRGAWEREQEGQQEQGMKPEYEYRERKLCAHPFIEIYRGDRIHFMGPLARQSDFYVPELREEWRQDSEDSEEDRRTDITGADSNSETSSVCCMISGTRESSLALSSAPTQIHQDQACGDHWSDRSSDQSSSSFEELDLDLVEHQEQADGVPTAVPYNKCLEVTTEEREAVPEGEE